MADINCKACEDLTNEVPTLFTNGLTDAMCTSLKNDTGLKSSSGHNDCEDLTDMNDCLIGNLDAELEKYEVCDWKTFMHQFIPNLYTTLAAYKCAICGLWSNVHSLWSTLNSFCIEKTGKTIKLTNKNGTLCSVTDSDTTYSISKDGNTIHLVGSDGSDDSVSVPDTWKPNTASQEGYVTKSGDDPLSVWATNASGVPDWRSTVTLGGNLTLQNHSSPIGATKFWGLDSSMSIANDTQKMIKAGFTLDKGVWIVVCTIGYSGNSNGSRSVGLSFGSAGHHNGVSVAPAPSNRVTILTKTYIRVCDTDGEEVYLDAYQDSGQALNLTTNPDTYVYAVRIR